MGRSAKMHKRVPKKATSQPSQVQAVAKHTSTASRSLTNGQAKRKNNLKSKAHTALSKEGKQAPRVEEGSVLGGVDYVTLMMGSRRKAREEVNKML
ncbi:hypothetical protein K439DRAFT_118565 [Ramaria rubella]|nr:hypothetical protein K439DRAFT_118565 [Ramaria rubella]